MLLVQLIHKKIQYNEEVSIRQIQRYLRLNYLVERLLEMVDNEYMTLVVGVELSNLSEYEQNIIADTIYSNKYKMSNKQAELLRNSKGNITHDKVS